jgi:hypothetical protein
MEEQHYAIYAIAIAAATSPVETFERRLEGREGYTGPPGPCYSKHDGKK